MSKQGQFFAFLRQLAVLIRAREWWDSKLPFTLGVAYALAWRLRLPLHALRLPLMLLVTAGIAGAIYASIFNDFLDLKEDRLAGKTTGLMALSRPGQGIVIAASVVGMALVASLLSRYPAAFVCFAAVGVNFLLYSLPPIRLKARGAWGVLSIALGEHLLPALLAVALVTSTTGTKAPGLWLIDVSVWAVALGLRGILWHQLCDCQNDRASQTHTFGANYDPNFLRRLGERYVFPIELGAFGALLWLSDARIAWPLLACYWGMEWLRSRYLALSIVVVAPRPHFRFAMLEYYQLFFPVAFLMEFMRRDADDAALLLALQLLLFVAPAWLLLSHLNYFIRRPIGIFLRRRGLMRALKE